MVVFDFVRHAQGYHNLSNDNLGLRDPQLTPLGVQQCKDLQQRFPYHDQVRLLVASPLRRTLHTGVVSFAPAVARGIPVVGIPELQEVSALASDVGSPSPDIRQFEELQHLAKDQLDLSRLHPGWTHKGFDSPFAPTLDKLEERAATARAILRDLAKGYGEDDRIAVVTHGGFLHFLTEDYGEISLMKGTGWQNAEWRSYVFDGDNLRETPESNKARRGSARGWTETEQREFKAIYHEALHEELDAGHREGRALKFTTDYATAASGASGANGNAGEQK